jgi:hypothetical protein
MGTLVTIQVRSGRDEANEVLDRAFRWFVGVRHRRSEGELIALLQVSNQAVCTAITSALVTYSTRAPECLLQVARARRW